MIGENMILKKHAISNQQYEYFKERCLYWIELFGLLEWTFYISIEPNKNEYACVDSNVKEKIAHIRLADSVDEDECHELEHLLNRTALHEVLHIVIAELTGFAYHRHCTEEQIDMANEALVRRLENVMIRILP